jgi:GDP-4-dehydro-6-deoxy-D-mannose reductase
VRALVVGADGFVGRWLVRYLAESGDEVHGVVGRRYRPPLSGVSTIHAVDVRDQAALTAAVRESAPAALYYLAAISEPDNRERVAEAVGVGVAGAVNALAACAELPGSTRFLFVSSAHVYGAGTGKAIAESTPVAPLTVYGAAKAAAEAALQRLAPAVRVELIIARPFNHIGPGQAPPFLVPSLVAQLPARANAGRAVITVRDTRMVRDYTDVRDVVRAYRLLVERGESGAVYNVASGTSRSVQEVVDALVVAAGVTADLVVDGAIDRGAEPSVLIGDASRLAALGWRPEYDFRRTLADVLTDAALQRVP